MIRLVSLAVICSFFSFSGLAAKKMIFTDIDLPQTKNSDFLSFLQDVSDLNDYGIETEGLELKETKHSLLGRHLHFVQKVNGTEVFNSSLFVSIDEDNRIFKLYNTTKTKEQIEEAMSAIPFIPFFGKMQAMQAAWDHLKVDGKLLSTPKASLQLELDENQRLLYSVLISSTSPYGHWRVKVDATNGSVVAVEDQAIERKASHHSIEERLSGTRVTGDFEAAFSASVNKGILFNKSGEFQVETLASGWATIFDPNPTTTLQRDDLEDRTPADEFEDAYFKADLKEISLINGVYHLKGPKVTLVDFDPPTAKVTTSATGVWDHKRGEAGFNDAMTYIQIDRSMRYLEELGYTREKTIFPKSIEVDSNGARGGDNSYYQPAMRRLSFGHGCVDDNEDTDVILHELGHAINHHINESWRGGDTPAIGEGFGDYWAASYSVSRKNGLNFKPNWVFKWDGHNRCWAGRRLDRVNLKYVHSRRYGPHQRMPEGNGAQTDELWSTPVFQAFLELYKDGVKREVMDTIMIESQFGLGFGIKMRDLATSIVETAKKLYPEKRYYQAYVKNFKRHGILE